MADSTSPADRLARLRCYLQQDPDNRSLLAETCEAALAAGALEQAQACIDAARAGTYDWAAWTFRQARVRLLQRQWEQAAALLQELEIALGPQPAIVHDRAYAALLQGDARLCRSLLEQLLAATNAAPQHEALQMLWLRALHRLGEVAPGLQWARAQAAGEQLTAGARGVASLLAIDAGDFVTAEAWSAAALQPQPAPVEALVAQAMVALARGDVPGAQRVLDQAVSACPDDGRIRSTLAMASLRAGDLVQAQRQCEAALATLPTHVGTWHALGWARLLQRDRAGALQAFRRALDLDRNFAESHGAVGLVLALAGEGTQAERHLTLADRLDPDNVTGRYARALLRGEAGDRQRLQALAARLLDRPGFFGGRLSDSVRVG